MYPSSNPTGEASIHHYGNFSYLAEFSTDGLKKMKSSHELHLVGPQSSEWGPGVCVGVMRSVQG